MDKKRKLQIFCDFDGTITKKDTLNSFFRTYADTKWLEVEADWRNGKIGSAECIIKQMQLLRDIDTDTVDKFLKNIEIDEYFPEFLEFIKENDIIIAETGIIPHGIAPMKFPDSTELQTQTLWGSIGWGTPATLGACLAKPKSRVVLITGEGSHQLTAMEIGNMLRRDVKPIIIVLNNNGYTIERVLSDSPNDKFNDIMQMNYSKFARVFEGDVWSTKVNTEEDFDKALKVTQIMNKMCYIEICTDAMDMPKLTEDLISNFRKNNQITEKSTPEQYCETTKEIIKEEKKENSSINFETVVHKGLLEE